MIGAGLGLRESEAAGLTMDRLDFLRRTVRVDRQWQQTTASKPGAFTPTKTAAGAPIIPVGEWVLDELNLHSSGSAPGTAASSSTPRGVASTPPAGATT